MTGWIATAARSPPGEELAPWAAAERELDNGLRMTG